MKKVKFWVSCVAGYKGELIIKDDSLSEEDILDEIRDRLEEVPVSEIEWVRDYDPQDAVEDDSILSIEDIEEE